MASRRWITMCVTAAAVAFASAAWGQERGPEGRRRGGGRGADRRPVNAGRGAGPATARGERLFGALDADRDGKIDRYEFSKRMPEVLKRLAGRARMTGDQGQRRAAKAKGLPCRLREMVHRAGRDTIRRTPMGVRWSKGDAPPPPGPAFRPPGMGWHGGGPGFMGPHPHRRFGPHGAPGKRPEMGRHGPGGGIGFKGLYPHPRQGPHGAPGLRPRGPHGQGPVAKRSPHGRMKMGGPPVFGQIDANRDGKLQTPELKHALGMLQQAVRESDGREITQKRWAEITKKLRAGPQRKQPPAKAGPAPPPGKRQPPKGWRHKPTRKPGPALKRGQKSKPGPQKPKPRTQPRR